MKDKTLWILIAIALILTYGAYRIVDTVSSQIEYKNTVCRNEFGPRIECVEEGE